MLTSLLRDILMLLANHSMSDIKVCAISPISGGNDSGKRHEKRLIFKIGTIHPHVHTETFSCVFVLFQVMSWLFSIRLRTVNNTKTQENISVCMGPKNSK